MSGDLSDSPQTLGAASSHGAPRTLCTRRWPGVEFVVKEQDISKVATWTIAEERHVAVVHLDGPIHRLETELSGAGALVEPPMAGEVWVIPAHSRYSSRAHGRLVRYAELFFEPQS